MSRTTITWTDNRNDSLAQPGRVKIEARRGPCHCGCGGRDSWHARTFVRVVRDVVLAEPVVLSEGSQEYGVAGTIEIARGTARFPWGVEEVRAVALRWPDGADSMIADWELVNLK